MAADQRRKGLNGAVADTSLRDKSRGKKKQVGSLESNGLRVKPHVSLEWDASRKRVIARREQIGLSWRNLRRFAGLFPPRHKILADAFDVPAELFELENLEGVLSYEVWQTCLSERERRFLSQFLPKESEPQQTVEQLLAGENFHFGNPSLDWVASLLSGGLHPDATVHREQSLKDEKSAYYLELRRYHNDMIGSLSKVKERWQSSRDLEREFNQKSMRPRKDKERKFLREDRSEFRDLDDGLAGTSKSSSLDEEEKTSNSYEQIESFKKARESQKRISKKRPVTDNSRNPAIASDNVFVDEAKPRKGVKLKRRNIVYNDGTKYMSYVKISKKQHELAKSMEQSGSSIQPRSLGDLANLHIQPYEVFVEEQRKKLHDHWLHLANHDLPSAYGIWNDIRSQRQQMMRSLEQELLDRHSFIEDDGVDTPESRPLAQKHDEGVDEGLIIEEDRESPPCFSHDRQDDEGADDASSLEDDEQSTVPGFVNNHKGDDGKVDHQFVAKNHDESLHCSDTKMVTGLMLDPPGGVIQNDDANSVPGSSQDPFLNQTPSSSSGNHSFNHVDPESEMLNSESTPHDVSAYSGSLNGADLIDTDQIPLSQGSDMWQPVSSVSSIPLAYYDSPLVGCQFNSAAEIPLPSSLSSIDGEQRAPQWIDVESNLHGQPQQVQGDSNSFISYPNHLDQNELLQSIFNGQQGMIYPGNINNQQKHLASLNFHLPSSVLPETYGQRMQSNIQQNMSTGSVTNGGSSRFLMPQRQQEHHLLSTSVSSVQDWSQQLHSTVQSPQPLSGPNWFNNSNEHQVRGGDWASTSGGPSQTNNLVVDQSMYGISPHCNQLSSRPPSYDSVEQFAPSRNYGHGLMSGNGIGNVLSHHNTPPLDYVNRRDEDTGWMSLPPNQNSGMNDSMGKPPYLGSWNP